MRGECPEKRPASPAALAALATKAQDLLERVSRIPGDMSRGTPSSEAASRAGRSEPRSGPRGRLLHRIRAKRREIAPRSCWRSCRRRGGGDRRHRSRPLGPSRLPRRADLYQEALRFPDLTAATAMALARAASRDSSGLRRRFSVTPMRFASPLLSIERQSRRSLHERFVPTTGPHSDRSGPCPPSTRRTHRRCCSFETSDRHISERT